MEKISVVIPTFNGSKRLPATIYTIEEYLKKRGCEYEIIVINDGSTDDTKDILESLRIKRDFKLISYPDNRGKGYAIRTGLIGASYHLVCVLDDDLSVSITELDNFKFEDFPSPSIVKGTRIQVVRQPLYRIMLGKIWKILVYFKMGIYEDTQCPFLLISCPKEFYHLLYIDGFAFDIELLYKARKNTYPIRFVPVKYFNDAKSTVTPKKVFKMLQDLVRIE